MVLAAVALLGGAYVLVGWTLTDKSGGPSPDGARVARALVSGFAVTPLLLGWLALACGGDVGQAGLLAITAAALAAWWLRRGGAWRPRVPFPGSPPLWVLGLAVAVALVINASYVAWLLRFRDASDALLLGTAVFDFEKHAGMLAAVAAWGFPPQHPLAPGVSLTYYLGFYMAPAALATFWPSAALHALVAQFVCAAVVVACLAYLGASHLGRFGRARPLTTTVVVLSGLSLGADLPGFAARGVASLTSPLWHAPLHIEPVADLLLWAPHHAVAAAYAVFLLATWEPLGRRRSRDALMAAALPAAVMTLSAFVGALLVVTAVSLLVAAGVRTVVKRSVGEPGQPASLPRSFGRPAVGVAATVLLALPFYVPIARAGLSGNLPLVSVFAVTESVVFNLGTLIAACGAGLVGLVAFAWLGPQPAARALRPVWVLLVASALLVLVTSRVSEATFTGLYVLQLGLPFLLVQVLAFLPRTRPQANPWVLSTLACLATWSAAYGLVQTSTAWRAAPRGSSEEAALVEWVQHHTPVGAVVNTLTLWQTSFDYRFGRVGASGGVGIFSRLEDRWACQSELRRYLARNAPGLSALALADYVLVPTASTRYFDDELPPASSGALAVLEAHGFVVEQANGAGTILRNRRLPGPFGPLTVVELQGQEAILAEGRRLVLAEHDYDRAARLLDLVASAPEPPAEAAYLLAFSLHLLGRDPLRALALYGQALEAGYAEFWVRYNRGALQTRLGHHEAACADLRRARELDPAHEGVGVFLARLDGCGGVPP